MRGGDGGTGRNGAREAIEATREKHQDLAQDHLPVLFDDIQSQSIDPQLFMEFVRDCLVDGASHSLDESVLLAF
ncbi:hypothetical protein [Ancylobacter sp. G4_0304]|uniref:hypothetical protein n=1 Tax=Ancylobacter sp. G4_0304 TaxID=3114289 RepID=UPI0039C62067